MFPRPAPRAGGRTAHPGCPGEGRTRPRPRPQGGGPGRARDLAAEGSGGRTVRFHPRGRDPRPASRPGPSPRSRADRQADTARPHPLWWGPRAHAGSPGGCRSRFSFRSGAGARGHAPVHPPCGGGLSPSFPSPPCGGGGRAPPGYSICGRAFKRAWSIPPFAGGPLPPAPSGAGVHAPRAPGSGSHTPTTPHERPTHRSAKLPVRRLRPGPGPRVAPRPFPSGWAFGNLHLCREDPLGPGTPLA